MQKYNIKVVFLAGSIFMGNLYSIEPQEIQNRITQLSKRSTKKIDDFYEAYLASPCREVNNGYDMNGCLAFLNKQRTQEISPIAEEIDSLVLELAESDINQQDCNNIEDDLKRNITIQTIASATKIAWLTSQDKDFASHIEHLDYLTLKINRMMHSHKTNYYALGDYFKNLEKDIKTQKIIVKQ